MASDWVNTAMRERFNLGAMRECFGRGICGFLARTS